MNIALLGSILNIILSFFFLLSSDYDIEFAAPMVACGTLSVLGWIVMGKNEKVGAYMTIIGSIPFVPLGLIAIFGGVRVLLQGKRDVEKWEDLH